MAHEIAHAWFGGIISPAASDDVWISEGGATYSQLIMGKALRRDDFDEELKRVLKASIRGNETENPYDRGAMVFYTLQSMMGDDLFSSFIKEIFERYGGKEITTADFVDLADEYGDYPLDELLYAEIVPDAMLLSIIPWAL